MKAKFYLFKKLKAAYASGNVERICAHQSPAIGGFSAHFFRNVRTLGGWVQATDSIDPAHSETCTFEIEEDWVELAEAIRYDCNDSAAYSRTLLALSDEIRGNATCGKSDEELTAAKARLEKNREQIEAFGECIAFGSTSDDRRFRFYRDAKGRFAVTDDRPTYTKPTPEFDFIFEELEPEEFKALAEACDVMRELMRKPSIAGALYYL